jgi:hypothetical protein
MKIDIIILGQKYLHNDELKLKYDELIIELYDKNKYIYLD